jgi:hypothetical protein
MLFTKYSSLQEGDSLDVQRFGMAFLTIDHRCERAAKRGVKV